jgi:hypothetical protein
MRNWFNQADATYRGDLRELNELNFARFDAKLEQRVAQLDAKLEQGLAAVRADVARLDGKLEQRLVQSDAKLEQRLAELRGDLRNELHAQGRMLMRWMVGLWMTAIGLLSGLIVAALHFLPAARP